MREELPANWQGQVLYAYAVFSSAPTNGETEFGVGRWMEILHPRGPGGRFRDKPRAQIIKELPRHQQGLARSAARYLPADEADIATSILSNLHDLSPGELEMAAALVRSMDSDARRRGSEQGRRTLRELQNRIRVESHARWLEGWKYASGREGSATEKELERRRRARLSKKGKAKDAYQRWTTPPRIVGPPIRVLPGGEFQPFKVGPGSAAPAVLSGEQG